MTTMTRRSEHLLALARRAYQPSRGFSGTADVEIADGDVERDEKGRPLSPEEAERRRQKRQKEQSERAKRADEDQAGGIGSPGSEPGVAIGPMGGGKGSGDGIQKEDRNSKMARLRNAGLTGGILRFALKSGREIAALNRSAGRLS